MQVYTRIYQIQTLLILVMAPFFIGLLLSRFSETLEQYMYFASALAIAFIFFNRRSMSYLKKRFETIREYAIRSMLLGAFFSFVGAGLEKINDTADPVFPWVEWMFPALFFISIGLMGTYIEAIIAAIRNLSSGKSE